MRRRRPILGILGMVAAGFTACQLDLSEPLSVIDRQPRVTAVWPADDEEVSPQEIVIVEFSAPIDPSSVDDETVRIIPERLEPPPPQDGPSFLAALEKGLSPVVGEWRRAPNGKTLVFSPQAPFEGGSTYSLVVSPTLVGEGRIPFNQTPGEGPTPFVSRFRVVKATPRPTPARGQNPQGDSSEEGTSPESPPDEEDGLSRVDGEGEPTEETQDHGENDQSGGATEKGEAPPKGEAKIVINELYYDAPGSDTDGVLFVELYGPAGASLAGLKIVFVNGDDGKEVDSITLPDDAVAGPDGFYVIADARTGNPTATQVGGADLIDNFDPQNGPDSVQLLAPDETLVDALGYGDGAPGEGNPTPDVVGGHSLSRRRPGLDTDDNATDFIDLEVPTPGML